MNPIVVMFVKKYAAAVVARGVQAVGVWLVAKHQFDSNDVAQLQGAIDPTQVVGWVLTVLPEAYHAWSNKKHAVLKVDDNIAKGLPATSQATPTPPHGAMSMTLAMLFIGCLCAQAQTNVATNVSTNTPTVSIPALTLGGAIPTNVVGAANDVIKIVSPIIPYLTNIHGLSLDLDGVYSSGKYGGIAALNVTIPGFMTNYLTVGIAGEDVADKWYISPIDTKLGISYNIPLLNIPAYSFVGTGLSIRPQDGAYGEQSIIGEAVSFQLGKGWYIVGDGGKLLLTQPNAPASSWFGGFRIGKSF